MGMARCEMLGFCSRSDFYPVSFNLKETHDKISNLSLTLKMIISTHMPLSGEPVSISLLGHRHDEKIYTENSILITNELYK